MTHFLRFTIIAVAGATVLSGLGCSQKGDGETPAVTGKSSRTKLKIVFIPKNTGNAYFDEVIEGFKEEAGKIGADFTTTGPAKADDTSQISYIKEQVQKGVDVIAITPNSPVALNSTLDEAKAKGVLIITVDADLTGNEDHRSACVLPAEPADVSAGLVETVSSQLKDGGEIAILSATQNASNQNEWIAGMKKTLADPKYAKLKLVDTVYGDDQPEKSATEAQALFSKHPNLRGIISPTSVGLPATAQAMELAGNFPGGPHAAGGGIVLTGLSTPKQMTKYVQDGVVTKFQLWSPRDMGVLACLLAEGLKSGKIKADEGVEVDVPGAGKRKFGAKGLITAGPMVTFDKANIAKYSF